MNVTFVAIIIAATIFLCGHNPASAQTAPPIPNPILSLTNVEQFSLNGKALVRYRYGVSNSSSYPDAMFAPAPALQPCGKNTNASRTWVDLYAQDGKRLYGFCAFSKSSDLGSVWFTLEEGVVPPSWIYIELKDRETGAKYKSNLAETTN